MSNIKSVGEKGAYERIMNSRERVFAALELKEPDRVPILEFGIHQEVMDNIARKFWGLESIDLLDFVARIGLDGACTNEEYHREKLNERLEVDEWGIVRDLSAGQSQGYPIEGPINSMRDLEKYTPPDPWAPHRWKRLKKIVERFKVEKAVIVWIHDAFLIPANLRGGEHKLLMDFYDNPKLAKALAELSTEYHVALVKHALKLGAEVFGSGDDYAYKTGPMMSPQHFREFILPGLKKVVNTVKEGGGYFIKHSDGNVWSLLDMFIEAGVDAINPLEPVAGMDIGEVKKKYGHRVAIVGNIDCGEVLSRSPVEAVREAVMDCLRRAAPGGGYIMSSSNSIHRGVKAENYMEMIRVTQEYGEYPIRL